MLQVADSQVISARAAIRCRECVQGGKNWCSLCNGTGSDRNGNRPDDHGPHICCGACDGTGLVTCDTCHGTDREYFEAELPEDWASDWEQIAVLLEWCLEMGWNREQLLRVIERPGMFEAQMVLAVNEVNQEPVK